MKTFALAAALLLAATSAPAQTRPVYRCGNGNYQHQPCEGGAVLATGDQRSAAQRAEARRVAQRERELSTRRQREREEAERGAKKAGGAATLGAAAAAPAASAAEPARKDFVARVPVDPKAEAAKKK
jgi:hypothetical protein